MENVTCRHSLQLTYRPVIDAHLFETGSDKAEDPDTINLWK